MKISEILQLAIDKEYWLADRNKYGSVSRTFMCIAVNDMYCIGLITHKELFAVKGHIEYILGEEYTLTDYLRITQGLSHEDAKKAEVRLNFWNQVIKELQAKRE